jgi:hypothetical protein
METDLFRRNPRQANNKISKSCCVSPHLTEQELSSWASFGQRNQTILTSANAVTVIGMRLPMFSIVYRDCSMWFLHQIGPVKVLVC